jgi:hypothetical protein
MNSKAFYEKSPHGKKKSQLNTVATHNSAKPILMSDLFSRIGIGPPYFALQEIIATPRGTLTATAQAEYPEKPNEIQSPLQKLVVTLQYLDLAQFR